VGLIAILLLTSRMQAPPILIEAAKPVRQKGSTGDDTKAAASSGHVLGSNWGSRPDHFAQYDFDLPKQISQARVTLRYAREFAGDTSLTFDIDGRSMPNGTAIIHPTGGWGDRSSDFRQVIVYLQGLMPGKHSLTVRPTPQPKIIPTHKLSPSPTLDLVGGRDDKNTLGHGRQVALYTGSPALFFYATQNLTDVFSAADGRTLAWYPDYSILTPGASSAGNVNLDLISIDETPVTNQQLLPDPEPRVNPVTEERQVCVTKDDVTVARYFFTNRSTKLTIFHTVNVTGDCRRSADFRGRPGGAKETKSLGNGVLMVDHHVFPEVLKQGLQIVVRGDRKPEKVDIGTPGAYRLTYVVEIPPNTTRSLTVACAIDRALPVAERNLSKALGEKDPLQENRDDWAAFYRNDVPSFTSSDRGLNEIYAFRWFLLMFSRAGGDLGYLKYPVDLEGRQAFQTYCCYSAPYMAFDLSWQTNPMAGFGQIANENFVAYDDGRYPWYATPATNRVPVDHESRTGQSAMPWAAWKFYQIHGRKDLLAKIYPGIKKNLEWWIADRDPDGNGLFTIADQMETGMDDLNHRWKNGKPKRYEAVDATSYAVLNLRAIADMARVLGHPQDAKRFGDYATKASRAMQTIMWDPQLQRFRDRNPDNGELSDYNSITTFYPMFAESMTFKNLPMIRRYLLNPKEFATPYPVPALSKADPEFDPVHRYWAGPTWPATNSHVVEGFADTAKQLDRSLLPAAAKLFKQTVALHLRPRADFYEHYNSLTGEPESGFRDYMHSWWVDTIIRHVAGMMPQDDGSLMIDPLPMGLKHFALRGAPYRGHRIDVLFNEGRKGLVVNSDRRLCLWAPSFEFGRTQVSLSAKALAGRK